MCDAGQPRTSQKGDPPGNKKCGSGGGSLLQGSRTEEDNRTTLWLKRTNLGEGRKGKKRRGATGLQEGGESASEVSTWNE